MKRPLCWTALLALLLAGCASSSSTERDSNGSTSDAGSTPPVSPFPCVDPAPLGGGRYWCAGGFVHRPAPETCPGTGFCTSDADCDGEVVCECGTQIAVGGCIRSTCTSDGDCEGGLLCTSYVDQPSHGVPDPVSNLGFGCQRVADTCASDAQCDPGRRCFMSGGARTCEPWDGPVSAFPGPLPE